MFVAPGWLLAVPSPVTVLKTEGAIVPATAGYIERGLSRGEKEQAQLVVLQMDTPDGLDTSMRQIIKAIPASKAPVAADVAPSGARDQRGNPHSLRQHIVAMA